MWRRTPAGGKCGGEVALGFSLAACSEVSHVVNETHQPHGISEKYHTILFKKYFLKNTYICLLTVYECEWWLDEHQDMPWGILGI